MGEVMNQTIRRVSWIDWLIFASSVLFILVLALSAFYDPSIRVLHLFQALIYVAVILLTRRGSAWGVRRWLNHGYIMELDELGPHYFYQGRLGSVVEFASNRSHQPARFAYCRFCSSGTFCSHWVLRDRLLSNPTKRMLGTCEILGRRLSGN